VSGPEAVYTHGHAESVLRSHRRRTAQDSAGYLLPHLRSGMTLLDTADLATVLGAGQVTALEVTEAALDLARTEADARGQTNMTFAVGTVQALDFPDDTFDVVHAHQVLQHLGDPVQALQEMHRVCKPGGLIAVRDSDYAAFTWFPALPELDDWLALYRQAARDNGAEPDAGRRLLHWAQRARLERITATSSTWCFATPEDRAWWGGMWADRILHSDLTSQLLDSTMASEADLQRISQAWRTWAESPDGWLSILHGELLVVA
jgi:SAM-dependent methyltransferase